MSREGYSLSFFFIFLEQISKVTSVFPLYVVLCSSLAEEWKLKEKKKLLSLSVFLTRDTS